MRNQEKELAQRIVTFFIFQFVTYWKGIYEMWDCKIAFYNKRENYREWFFLLFVLKKDCIFSRFDV